MGALRSIVGGLWGDVKAVVGRHNGHRSQHSVLASRSFVGRHSVMVGIPDCALDIRKIKWI